MRQCASSPRSDKSGYERSEEREYKGPQKARVAHQRMASLPAASFPRRNECPGSPDSTGERRQFSAREFEVKEKMEKRTVY